MSAPSRPPAILIPTSPSTDKGCSEKARPVPGYTQQFQRRSSSRADVSRDAVNALEVVDPGSRGFAPRPSWPGLLQFERNEAEQLSLRAA